MRTPKLRLLALLVAALMALGILPVLAEAPVPPTDLISALYDSGRHMKTEFSLQISPMLGGLLMNFMGEAGEDGAAEQSMALLNTAVNALNKLKTTVIAGKDAVSGHLGTDKGNLLDFQVAVNQETGENHITSDLLPGLNLSVDPAIIKQMTQGSTTQMSPQQAMEMAAPYLAVFQGLMAKVQAGSASEEGSFEIAGYGTFTKRSQFTLTSHMMADLLDQLGQAFDKDANLKKFLEEAQKAAPAGQSEQMPQDLGKELKDAAAKGKAEPDNDLLFVTAYEDAAGTTYLDMVSPEGADKEAIKLDVLTKGGKEGGDLQLSMRAILKSAPEPVAEGTEVPITDWLALENQIKTGENYRDTLINLSFSMGGTLPEMQGQANINIIATGMNMGLSIASQGDMAKFENQTDIAISFMMPEPLLSIHIKSEPTTEAPVAPVTEGTQGIVLKEGDLSEADQAKIGEAVQAALPLVLERLNVALPEEAPTLLALFAMTGGETEVVQSEEVVEAP